MGGMTKGAHGNMHAAYSYSRRRWANMYVVMVIVCSVFGCGVLGLMGLHRLRERRSLNLLIKEKDDQILSLHLLLQKEREHMVQVKRKTEELKMKIMNLGSQKADLSSRISDMQLTISTLKEEQRAVELAFEEKQNEAKLSREKYMQAKEAEVEDLKHRLQLQGAEGGAVSAQERLIIPSNATAGVKTIRADQSTINEKEGGESVYNGEKKNIADASRDGETESSMNNKEEIDGSSGNGGTNADRTNEEVEPKYSTDQEKKEYENGKIEGLGHQDQELPRRSNPHSSDNQEVEVHGGKMKMEMQENYHRFKGKHGYLRRSKGKRWRSIARQTEERNAASTMAGEDRPPGGELRDNIQREDTNDSISNTIRNSSSEKNHVSIQELAKQSAIIMEDTGSANKDAVQRTEENKQSEEQIRVVKPMEDRHKHQHTYLLGRKEDEADGVQKGDSEESELGVDNEEKEETNAQEF